MALGCATLFTPPENKWPSLPSGHFMHVGDFLQVSGVGKPPPKTKTMTQARSESRDAAILDAWERIRSYLHSLVRPDGSYVASHIDVDPLLAKRLESLIVSSAIVETKWSGTTAVVVMRISKTKINAVLETDYR